MVGVRVDMCVSDLSGRVSDRMNDQVSDRILSKLTRQQDQQYPCLCCESAVCPT